MCPPILRSISHDYPDVLPPPGQVRCYSFEEVFAEKLRAMGERSRPRKLYDIVNLFRRTDLHPYANLVLEVLEQKCKSKGVLVPSVMNIHSSPMFEELKSETYGVHCPVCGKPFHRVLRSERLRPLREPVGTWNCSGKVRLCGECRMILPAWRDRQSQHPAVSPLALVSNCHLPSGCLYFYGIKRPPLRARVRHYKLASGTHGVAQSIVERCQGTFKSLCQCYIPSVVAGQIEPQEPNTFSEGREWEEGQIEQQQILMGPSSLGSCDLPSSLQSAEHVANFRQNQLRTSKGHAGNNGFCPLPCSSDVHQCRNQNRRVNNRSHTWSASRARKISDTSTRVSSNSFRSRTL